MRLRYLILLVFPLLLLNCPKKHAPKIKKIEAIYISSLYEDIYREKPILTGIKNLPGIKIGHLKTEPPFITILLGKLGFYELLNGTGINFVLGDPLLFQTDNINYFFIPRSMGYAIKNYEGIRFAIFSKDKDSLTIDDEIKISLVKQRSDILWIIDENLIDSSPKKIFFYIKNRGLSDTSITEININPDTLLLKKLQNFKSKLTEMMSKKIYLENKSLDEYILSKIAASEDVNVILYPQNLFRNIIEKDSVSLQEILNNVICELKFGISTDITEKQILELRENKKYQIWGKSTQTNRVLLPEDKGKYLFDLLPSVKQIINSY